MKMEKRLVTEDKPDRHKDARGRKRVSSSVREMGEKVKIITET